MYSYFFHKCAQFAERQRNDLAAFDLQIPRDGRLVWRKLFLIKSRMGIQMGRFEMPLFLLQQGLFHLLLHTKVFQTTFANPRGFAKLSISLIDMVFHHVWLRIRQEKYIAAEGGVVLLLGYVFHTL